MSAGSDLVAMRRQVDHTCAVCGDHFTAIKTARYCSEKCKQRAKRARGSREA